MLALIITIAIVVGLFIGYLISSSKKESVHFEYLQSELSDPSISIPPYWFYAPHYRILERISYFSGFEAEKHEFTYLQINNWEKSGDRRAGELAKMWYLNKRVERIGRIKINYYSINKKGREAVLNFNERF